MTITSSLYHLLVGKPTNKPKSPATTAQTELQKALIALQQYKTDAEEARYINTLIAADLHNLIDKYTAMAMGERSTATLLVLGIMVEDVKAVLRNQNFNLTELLTK